MEKAFDYVDYSAITGALNFFGFDDQFSRWIMLFYTQIEVCTKNFGFFSDFFVKSRSTNQGCIISPAIFILISEILALKIKQDMRIRGLNIGGLNI